MWQNAKRACQYYLSPFPFSAEMSFTSLWVAIALVWLCALVQVSSHVAPLPIPVARATPTPSVSPSSSSSATPSATPSSATPSVSSPSVSPSSSSSTTPSVSSPSVSPSSSSSTTPSVSSPSVSPSSSSSTTPSVSSPSVSPSSSSSTTPSVSSPSVSPSSSSSASPSPSFSATLSTSPTPSTTPTISSTGSPSTSPSVSGTPSTSMTQTPSVTPSISTTASVTPTSSISSTTSATPTQSASATPSPSATASYSPSPSPSCIPHCQDYQCGADGCGGSCGTCEDGFVCSEEHLCTIHVEEKPVSDNDLVTVEFVVQVAERIIGNSQLDVVIEFPTNDNEEAPNVLIRQATPSLVYGEDIEEEGSSTFRFLGGAFEVIENDEDRGINNEDIFPFMIKYKLGTEFSHTPVALVQGTETWSRATDTCSGGDYLESLNAETGEYYGNVCESGTLALFQVVSSDDDDDDDLNVVALVVGLSVGAVILAVLGGMWYHRRWLTRKGVEPRRQSREMRQLE